MYDIFGKHVMSARLQIYEASPAKIRSIWGTHFCL